MAITGDMTTISLEGLDESIEEVFHASAQADNSLLTSVKTKIALGEGSHAFRVKEKLKMKKRTAPGQKVTHTPIAYGKVKVEFDRAYLSVPVDFQFGKEVDADLVQDAVDSVSTAMYETSCETLIGALEASTSTAIPGVITAAVIRKGMAQLRKLGLGTNAEIHGVISADTLEILLGELTATSRDYVEAANIVDYGIGKWCGIIWHQVPDEQMTDPKKVFIYDKNSVGLVYGMNESKTTYDANETSDIVQGFLTIGAKIIKEAGVVVLKGAA